MRKDIHHVSWTHGQSGTSSLKIFGNSSHVFVELDMPQSQYFNA